MSNNSQKKLWQPKVKQERVFDLSKQDNFLFNKTPILASALQRLKKTESGDKKKNTSYSQPKKNSEIKPQDLQIQSRPNKKVKKTPEQSLPSFNYSPLQKDLFNFYTINKISLKTIQSVPEPKFEVGSLILTAISDRGIGGKYLVTNLFRNKKGYIDYKQISQSHTNNNDFAGIQSYHQPGDFVLASVVKSINQTHLQLSLSKFIQIDPKSFRIGQVIAAQIKSKQQLGCHLIVAKCSNYKFFLPKENMDSQIFDSLSQNRQVVVTIIQFDHSKHFVKVQLTSQQQNGLNLRGVEQQQMSKLQLQQYVTPGTLLNTKVVKVLKNGIMVKFLKIFLGFIHQDHLNNALQLYPVQTKIQARIIYSTMNPPFVFLSEKHVNLNRYTPSRALYSVIDKPQDLVTVQNSHFKQSQQFFVHPSQLISQIENVNKFWVKQNNYFQRYQIMSSRKLGLRIGQVAKQIPFSNFKVYGDNKGQKTGKFKVMCLDMWNKVVKVSYDQKFIKSNNMLFDLQDVDMKKQYTGIIKNMNDNGVVIQFCNNIRGTLPKNQLKKNEYQINQTFIGKSIEVYINNIKAKRNFVTLSLLPQQSRKKNQQNNSKSDKKENIQNQDNDNSFGIIASVDPKSINPIYIKLKTKLIKISIFNGIKPASVQDISIIQNLTQNFQVGQKVRVFRRGKQYTLYPPEQICDKQLRICKVVGQKGTILRVQIGKSQFKNCHITDITDVITPYPFSQVKVGQYKIGRILNNGNICLRDSIVINGIPKSMMQCKQKYGSDQLRGDYRNRIQAFGSSALKEDTVVFGYVKNYTQKGCFVSISNDFEVRIQISQLSDQVIHDRAKHYPTNKLILCRLINQKVKHNDSTKRMFDASSRQSIIKMGYPINQQALMAGLTVTGRVTGYVKGKALIKLDGSKYTGIMHPNDVQNIDKSQPIQKSMKLGTQYKMKITEHNNENGKRLIRLSNLQRYFKKYQGVQLDYQVDKNAVNLWQNYLQMLKVSVPQNNMQIQLQQQQNQQDQYQRIKKLVNNQFNQQQNKQDQSEQQSEDQQQNQQDSQMIDQANQKKKVTHGLEQQLSKQQIDRRLAQFRQMNQTTKTYQSIVLANDSSQSHLQYISAMVSNPNVTPDQMRQQFVKSIALLHHLKDKQNMWIAWLNMQLILGDFMGLVKKAINADVGINVYIRIVQILRQQNSWDIAFEMAKKMLKKFKTDMKSYQTILKHMVLQQIHDGKQIITLKEILRRASQSLNAKDLITIQSQYAKILYEQKKPQQARTVFGNILTKNPKRTDIWSMYVDLQIKYGNIDKARQVLQRCLTIKLKRKKIITILKKYHQIQQQHGTAKSAAAILERAQQIAQQYQNQKDDASDNDQ